MVQALSIQDARRLLAQYHFQARNIYEVFEQFGSIQYDPLKPLGCNHDLVLQARVPAYKVDDWQAYAYEERFIYDGWDKQASLVLMKDWPKRKIYHTWHKAHWQEVLTKYPEAISAVLEELRQRGPLASAEFDYQVHKQEWEGSWHGPKLTKHVLRALWHTGEVMTSHRRHGHHIYDLSERIVPKQFYQAEPLSEKEAIAWLICLRQKACGLLRPNTTVEVWSMGVKARRRKQTIDWLMEQGELILLELEGVRFLAHPSILHLLDVSLTSASMRFLAPLDPLIWDRKAIAHLFSFEYLWEVYKPKEKRKWGYYVLPVFYKDRFVARFDARCKQGTWELLAWYWEPNVRMSPGLFFALENAVSRFKAYLSAKKLILPRGMDAKTRSAWQRGVKHAA